MQYLRKLKLKRDAEVVIIEKEKENARARRERIATKVLRMMREQRNCEEKISIIYGTYLQKMKWVLCSRQ